MPVKKKSSSVKDYFVKLDDEYKETIRSNAYLGKKGYSISKSIMTEEDIEFLKKDLFMKPVSMNMNFGAPGGNDETAFPVYRESTSKIYIPRFYGIQRYGVPDKSELQEGDDISIEFTKTLRDYQTNIVNTYETYCDTPICRGSSHKANGGILEVPCGRGKCLGKDTPILMYDGSIKLVQDVQVGDTLMGDDSTPRIVLSLARGREMMYKVSSKKGDGYIVNESHILSLKYSSTVNKRTPKGSVIDMSVIDYLNLPKSYHGKGGVLVGYRVPITFPEKAVDIDPYLLGYWLGDGHSKGTVFSTQETSVIKHLQQVCLPNNHPDLYIQYTGSQYDYRINSIYQGTGCNSMMNGLKKYDLINNKHIPSEYKSNSRKIQLELLAGIIDSDGHYHDNCYEVIQKNESLLDDIIYLARSLGFAAFKTTTQKTCTNGKNGPVKGTYYRTNIYGKGLEDIPLQCERKKAHPRKLLRDPLNYRIQLHPIGVDDYYGFEIDGNRRFVLGDFTVTHNTVMALKIISDLHKKTLIIVHKEFLMNQWIERIEEFLPGTKIGKIQGQTFDIEGKDIVIGMLQSLYDKDYGKDAFSSFGLTVIDEVHRIGSEQFSKTLFKAVTPYMLGISATVDRKDGLTKVLYMFIGDKIYSETREDDDPVCVRAIQYHTNDTEFNDVEYDFRGNPKYSTMITKLCAYEPRTIFISRVVKDLISEDVSKQIMILCHNRSLLTSLFEKISQGGFASVGYYVGGMKQKDLQETETKQIVLATYAMAAEALDIKTLSTLIMVTPKTDITQSVGRILRVKHENPVIVDIIDQHEPFQKQWLQRKRFYKKCNYLIKQATNIKYENMSLDWKQDNDVWKTVYDPKKPTKKSQNKKNDDDDESKKCLIDVSLFDFGD